MSVGVRSGDTSAADRRSMLRTPPDILITTPESLFLMLTSAARESLDEVETVIVDEVHAIAGSKRGSHLALSLERLDAALTTPAQRIGLSATVRPPEEVGRFLTGTAPITIVDPPAPKTFDLSVRVPLEDMTELGVSGSVGSDEERSPGSIWPHVESRHRRPGAGAPFLHRVRQLAPARRAPHRAAQRDLRRAPRVRRRPRPCPARHCSARPPRSTTAPSRCSPAPTTAR